MLEDESQGLFLSFGVAFRRLLLFVAIKHRTRVPCECVIWLGCVRGYLLVRESPYQERGMSPLPCRFLLIHLSALNPLLLCCPCISATVTTNNHDSGKNTIRSASLVLSCTLDTLALVARGLAFGSFFFRYQREPVAVVTIELMGPCLICYW